ncbi:MAG: YwaF family protein, partial [Firmicutes bacterium]|nr:YwaF family protein [Bacillota bacterium]
MEIIFYILIIAGIAIGLCLCYFLLKNIKHRQVFYLVLVTSLVAAFFIRTMIGQNEFAERGAYSVHVSALRWVMRINQHGEWVRIWTDYQPLGMVSVAIGYILLWLNIASFVTITMTAFFNMPFMSRLVMYFFLPISVLSIVFFAPSAFLLEGASATDGFNLRVFLYALEVALVLSLCIFHTTYVFKKANEKADKIANDSKAEQIDIFADNTEAEYTQHLQGVVATNKPNKKGLWAYIKTGLKTSRKEVLAMLAVFPIILIVTMPIHTLIVFVGLGGPNAAERLTFQHRVFIYLAFAIPFLLYAGINKLRQLFKPSELLDSVQLDSEVATSPQAKITANAQTTQYGGDTQVMQTTQYGGDTLVMQTSEQLKTQPHTQPTPYVTALAKPAYTEVVRYAILFVAVATLIGFSINFPLLYNLRPTRLPLHLCNTAMYILPIVLIFRMKRVFYFTFFINVFGAFAAILMPNYGGYSILHPTFFSFWLNHYIAFFLPLLCVALGIFPRPTVKIFGYSIAGFAVYFVGVAFTNAWASNYGNVDYFFLNSTFIIDHLPGSALQDIMNTTVSFTWGSYYFSFYILYKIIFFIVYIILALGMWLIYEYWFNSWDSLRRLFSRKEKIELDALALKAKYGLKSLDEPLYPEGADLLVLRNVSKTYDGKKYAVKNASLEVGAGEIFGFLGPNGAGKSTIIKSLVGLQTLTGGQMVVCGFDVEKQSQATKSRIGFVPDHYALYERLTGREYVNYIADLYDVELEKRNQLIEHFLKIFELAHAFDSQMRTYSHGMKQKIAIMAALIHSPKV